MQQESSGAGKARRRRRAKTLALKREGHGVKRHTAQEAATLQRINYALSATLDLGEILQHIITEVVQLLVAQSASVILHDDVTHEAELTTTYGQGATVQTLRYPLPGSLTGWVAEHQRPLRVSRLSQDEWPTVWQLAEQLGATPSPVSVLLAPLWVQGKIEGSLEVVWEEGHVITDNDERLLEAIAVQAAIGITHAQLYQEKERALRAVQESEQRLKAQYQGIPVPTYTWQRRGEDLVLVEYNHAANTISHGRIAEWVGIRAAELYHDAPDLLTLLTRCLTEQRSLKKEGFYQLRTTGERKQLAISYVFVPPDLVMMHTEDITERKQAEEALRKSEAQFRAIFTDAGIGMSVADMEGHILQSNPVFHQMLGYSQAELTGKVFPEVTHPDDVEKNLALFAELRAGKRDRYQLEKRYLHWNGHVVWGRLTVSRVQEASGTPQLAVAMIEDITEWKRAEAALRESEERYRMVSQVISDYAFSIHFEADGSISYDWLTESFTKITGYEVAEILDKPNLLQRYIPPEDLERLNTIIRRLPPGAITSYEFRIICRDGRVRWLRSYAQPLFDEHGQLSRLYGATQDITERKRDEEEKRKLQDQLFRAQKLEAIGTLAGGIAHDFNNILTIILGFSELLKKAVLADAVARGNLEEVLKAGNRAKELVQQLLAFSRPEQQTRRPVDLHLVVAESLRLLRAVLPTTIAIRSSLDPSGAVVLANATQLHRVIMNLGVNALQAMQDTGGVLEVRVEPTIVTSAFARVHPSLTPGAYCQLTVRDTGCGMTPEVMARIFDPFFTTQPVGEGSGLGLSVIYGIVSSYGGTVTVDSTPGQGTAFAVYLPQSTEVVSSTAPVDLPTRSEPGRVVLFVDDEKAVVQMAQQMLEHLGYEAVVTTSSQEALDTFRHRPGHFDVVVTDQTMPGLTGDQLARELLALRPELPIILCTGFSPTLTEEKARALGARTYLRKPLSTAELGRALEDIFTRREEN